MKGSSLLSKPVSFRSSYVLVIFLILFWMDDDNNGVLGGTPNIIVSLANVPNKTWLAKRGDFGSLTKDKHTGVLVHSPLEDLFLCEAFNSNSEIMIAPKSEETLIMMAPRGMCTFERKAFAAYELYGASVLLVYDNLSARYRWDNETNRVIMPQNLYDYDCDHGYGEMENLEFDPPMYDGARLNPLMDMTLPLTPTRCNLNKTHSPCESQLCLVTSHKENSTNYPVCCAWDLPLTMGPDKTVGDTSNILSVFLTIRQTQDIFPYLGTVATIEPRPYTVFNVSIIFMWIMGVFIVILASWYAAQDYRIFRRRLARFQAKQAQKLQEQQGGTNNTNGNIETGTSDIVADDDLDHLVVTLDDLEELDSDNNDIDDDDDDGLDDELDLDQEGGNNNNPNQNKSKPQQKRWTLHSLPPPPRKKTNHDESSSTKKKKDDVVWVLYSLPPPERRKNKKRPPGNRNSGLESSSMTLPPSSDLNVPNDTNDDDDDNDDSSEPWATTKTSFELTQWHVLGFLISASAMLFLLFYFHFYWIVFIIYGIGCAGAVSHLIFGPALVRIIPKFGDECVKELNKNVVCGLNGFDVTSQLAGWIWSIVWMWYGLSHYRPISNPFFWITMDIFGACASILMLSMLKLSNIKIATMLMVAIFFYDVFFVFITPLFLDGESVMITVAKGGGQSSTVEDFCSKYPDHKDCTGIFFLPMLLALPRINDYTGGSILLGLGDIVLPGFLIAFCARVDEAKRLVGYHTKLEIDIPEKWYQGYFFPLVIAYGVGLFLAYLAFCLTEMGQPALLYLVPTCLTTMCFVGRKELKDLWVGARALRLAEKLKKKYERSWGREKMLKQSAKLKRERAIEQQQAEANGQRKKDMYRSQNSPRDLSKSLGGPAKGGRPLNARTQSSPTNLNGNNMQRPGIQGRAPSSRTSGRGGPPGRGAGRQAGQGKQLPRRGTDRSGRSSNSPKTEVQENLSGPDWESSQFIAPEAPKKGASSEESPLETTEKATPQSTDVCFGNVDHVGTVHMRKFVKAELKVNPDAEFSPPIFKAIKKRLKGRQFFVHDDSESWREASKLEIRFEIKKVFEEEQARMKSKLSESSTNDASK